MVREIVKDTAVLKMKSSTATASDVHIAIDLLDTANHHKDRCVGLAAIQIGEAKRVIVAKIGNAFKVFYNPVIMRRMPPVYKAIEGCMSLDGERTVWRHSGIILGFESTPGKRQSIAYSGVEAQILQHECDHCAGKLI